MKILRFDFHNEFIGPEKKDGALVAQFLDIYEAAWNHEAAPGIHAAGGKIITYFNFSSQPEYFQSGDPNPYYNVNWTLKDANGNVVYVQNVTRNKAYDPMNQEFRDYLVSWIQSRLDLGFDGVFCDNGFNPRFPDDFVYNARGIDLRTGLEYTDEDYARDRVDLLNYVKSMFPSAMFISNGFFRGTRFYRYYDAYLTALQNLTIDGVFSEGLFTDIDGKIWDEVEWKESVSMIEEIQDLWLPKGKIYVAYSHGDLGATYNNITKDQMAAFLYASALMGFSRDGNAFAAHNAMRTTIQNILKIDPGIPVETYTQIPDTQVFQRTFTKLKVFVNISKIQSYDIPEYGSIPPLGTLFIEEATPISPTVTLESIVVASAVGLATLPITKNPVISAVLALGGFTADILIRRAGRETSEEAFDFLY